MDDKFEKARQILLHPNFNKLTPKQIQETYRVLLASGLTKEDLVNILKSSSKIIQKQEVTYLESLPYNVFMNLILTGDIKGKELISLCNSSPLINEKCNKSFVGRDGESVPMFIFYALLKKLGMDFPGRTDYRNLYIKVSQNLPFLSLNKKLKLLFQQLDNLQNNHYMPRNINDLLYYNFYYGDLGLIISKEDVISPIPPPKIPNKMVVRYNRIQNVINNLEISKEVLSHKEIDYPLTSEKAAELENMNLKDFIENVMDYTLDNGSAEDYVNVNEKFRIALNDLCNSKFQGKINLTNIEKNLLNFITTHVKLIQQIGLLGGLADPNLETENIRILESITLDTEELEYLAYLHQKVLSGELPVLTPLKFEELIKY